VSDPCVFLDRDETIIEDPGFIDDPDQVRLKAGAADAIRRLRSAGFKVVVVTNQSGIARGLLDEEQLTAVHARLRAMLEQDGASVDAIYYCPYLDGPEAVVENYRGRSDLRKPSPGLLLQAAQELDLDLTRSWMIGDRPSDIEAGARAGCRTIRVAMGSASGAAGATRPCFQAESLLEAARMVEEQTSRDPKTSGRGGPSGPGAESSNQEQTRILGEIRDLLDRQHRRGRQEDFSFLRLFGTFAQMLAIVLALWGLFALFDPASVGSAAARFGLATFLQLVVITTYLTEHRG
jgi:D-glycero-D-manno-heptose 1,7-bisphosphate phosphatase